MLRICKPLTPNLITNARQKDGSGVWRRRRYFWNSTYNKARVVERSPQSDPKRRGRRRKKPPFCFGSSSHSIPSLTDQKEEFGEEEADLRCWIDPASSFMASSKKEILLPVSDPPSRAAGDESIFKGAAMTKRGAYAAISYMSCAVLLVMFNKAALSSYNFPCANVITLLQMICSTAILYAMRRWKLISFTVGESRSISDGLPFFVSFSTLLHTLPLAASYLLYMLATMESVRGVTVPMYTTLRRTTVVFTMIVEYLLTGQKYSSSVVGSVGLIVFGAFVAGTRDLSFDSYGYAIVFLSNITTAIYLATIARIGKSSGLNSFGLMWCNGLICGPALLFWTFIRGDLEMTRNFSHLYSFGFQALMLLSCIMAFFLNYSIFLNTTLNSALTQTMCGNLKDLFTIGLGWLLFGGLPFDLLNVIGQGLGFLGSGLYAYCKLTGK